MRDRIMGKEIEWAGGYRIGPDNPWIPVGGIFSHVLEMMRLEYKEWNFNSDVDNFIPNGARVYHEATGEHLEIALPECASARELLKFDKWSERFVHKLSLNLKEKKGGEIAFYKKNTDSNLQYTRGCHENYLSEKIFKKLLNESETRLKITQFVPSITAIHGEINYLILFLITRQIFTGSGGLMLYSIRNETDVYEISPRTSFIDAVLSNSTTQGGVDGRAIINTRNEPLADSCEYWRNHLILGDANMADLSIFLKFGTTAAIIEMIEEGFWDKNLGLRNPSKAPVILKDISKDLTLKSVPIQLKNDRNYTALQIQKRFCKNWRRYLKYTNQGGEKAEIAERWQETLNRLETDDEKLYSQLDWKIKMRLIWNFVSIKGLPLNHKSVIAIDNLYHSPHPENSFYYMLKNRPGSEFESLVSENEISDADKNPPETRAKLRTYIKKLCDDLKLSCNVVWDCAAFKSGISGNEHKILMPDPRPSSLSSLNSTTNIKAIKYLNSLKPGAIIV